MHEAGMEVNLDTHVIQKRGSFKYLGFIIQRKWGLTMMSHITDYVVWAGGLADQELPRLEDESCEDEDAEMDVWAY
ncbi:hypothetical protein H5410_037145 [Solanum commersonii]|uniref:Uncharacterized protein n=1 Tax=Solanum commersonii TaxID=4109 RepID=A0A9J5Y6A4_SOLCO|nr:hypothetical protein H5410_037145 [Solanum commersonii]